MADTTSRAAPPFSWSEPTLTGGRVGWSSVNRYRCAMSRQREQAREGLPPLPAADASDDERANAFEARWVARHGAPTIEDYRRVYASFGAPWPGDDEIRRLHVVADVAA